MSNEWHRPLFSAIYFRHLHQRNTVPLAATPPPGDFGIYLDLKKPYMFLCTDAIKSALEARKLSLSLHEIPVAREEG